MYRTAGTQLYTSAAVVAAERSLIAAAQLGGGRRTSRAAVHAALVASAANDVALNPGQAALVRDLATSGARLQLALAPAGTGKTTAMAVLTRAWTDDGGTVVGLAPSAAAAAVLGAELGAPTDTLAKLLCSLDTLNTEDDPAGRSSRQAQVSVPDWVRQIGPSTLVVLDEAGMAGTPELARAVEFVLDRGGSVRLIGDDQQLAAIGAGGVLRDVAETAGALTLSQVVRFHDPAEGAASLALRIGDKAAIGFYIDQAGPRR
jgi:ATP-dependent exoDNAse (exonuclease V) alpha subunit